MDLNVLLSKVGLSYKLTQDITLLLFIALASFIYGTFIGRYKLMTVLINIYVSFAIISVIPKDFIEDYSYMLAVFFGLLIVLTVANRRFFDLSFSGSGSGFMWRVFSMSFLQVVLILSIIFSILPRKAALTYISSAAYEYLASGWAALLWMALPLAYMIFIYKRTGR